MALPTTSGTQAALAAALPAELLGLFDDTFIRSCDLIEEYVHRLAVAVFRSTGLEQACGQAVTVTEAVRRAALAPAAAHVPAAWILRTLASRGWVEQVDASRYRRVGELPALDPEELAVAQAAHDPRCLPTYRIAALAAEHYGSVLRGTATGEDSLFAPDHIGTWLEYFSNDNPLYAIANTVGAVAAERALPPEGATVLELGGGLGSGAEALLGRLQAPGTGRTLAAYRFTEIVPAFLRRARKSLATRFPLQPLSYAWLDINEPFARAGIVPGSCSLVYGVNVLHVASDLAATLAEIRQALAADGTLVLAECVRPFTDRPVHVEFVFNLLESFRSPSLVPEWRPNGGFLTPEQWSAALAANGFRDIAILPDIAALRDAYPSFLSAAITARRA
jgi:SAM-dependent methyltransferase